jgi:hypothetical protein
MSLLPFAFPVGAAGVGVVCLHGVHRFGGEPEL